MITGRKRMRNDTDDSEHSFKMRRRKEMQRENKREEKW